LSDAYLVFILLNFLLLNFLLLNCIDMFDKGVTAIPDVAYDEGFRK
jgi:hypothetical protein